MTQHGKRYENALKEFDRDTLYAFEEAIKMAKKMATAKFDETIELHFRLGIDPRHSDQQVRSTVLLPHGLGKTVRILVFAEGEDARVAEAAGADLIGDDEMLTRIQGGFLDFDATIAVPSMMAKVGKVARVLGPRGLMPNPKAGTVVPASELPRVINELKAGRLEFRNDKTGNVHMPVGKASFSEEKLIENAQAAFDAVTSVKPSSAKGIYMRRLVVTSTMGPGVRVQL
jgi:large subunit ribosomal protein L1